MEDLGIVHLQDRPFGEMSTGEQRRFLLGRALVHDPEALVLDEPTSGLDLHACFHYLEIIRALMSKGKTVVLVTHHIHEIPPEVTRVVLLKKQTLITAPVLTDLFDLPVRIVEANGWYQTLPG
jgi:iron complex transport system ATP-binding protein